MLTWRGAGSAHTHAQAHRRARVRAGARLASQLPDARGAGARATILADVDSLVADVDAHLSAAVAAAWDREDAAAAAAAAGESAAVPMVEVEVMGAEEEGDDLAPSD